MRKCVNNKCPHNDNNEKLGCAKTRFKEQMEIGATITCKHFKFGRTSHGAFTDCCE